MYFCCVTVKDNHCSFDINTHSTQAAEYGAGIIIDTLLTQTTLMPCTMDELMSIFRTAQT